MADNNTCGHTCIRYNTLGWYALFVLAASERCATVQIQGAGSEQWPWLLAVHIVCHVEELREAHMLRLLGGQTVVQPHCAL